MERKDYADKFRDIKNEILKEIRELVPRDSAHHFSENFYVHYIEGEVATTEICSAVEVWSDGMVVFIVHRDTTSKDEVIEGETVFGYDSDSFLDILDHLKKDIREKKLSHLREIVKKHGGEILFDGDFRFTGDSNGYGGENIDPCNDTRLMGLSIDCDGKINIDDIWEGGEYCNSENFIPDDELDRIIAYVESKTKQKFVVRVSGSFSRTFEIEANNFDEALAEAKKDWEVNPLIQEDVNGEDWGDWTNYPG